MNIFNFKAFMPHGHCYLWQSDILFGHVISGVLISLCYLAIPVLLGIILHRRKDIPFRSTIKVFIIFIFFCSLTHIMEVITVWYPIYYISGIIKILTAIISIVSTAIILSNLKIILNLPSLTNIEKNIFDNVHLAMDKLPIGIIFSDSTGKINYHNEYISEVFGYKSSEIINKDVETLIPPTLRDQHVEFRNKYFNDPIDKKMGAGRVLTGLTKSQETKHLEIGLRPIPLIGSSSELTIIAIKDVTLEEKNRRKLEETLKLIHVATYGMPSLLSYINKDGYYEYNNEAYTRKWEVNPKDIVGKHYTNFLPQDLLEKVSENLEKALKGEEVHFYTTANFPADGRRECDVFYIPHISKITKKVEGVIVLAHDITEINSALRDLETSNKQLEEYAFLVSHDLRAPVRHISNFVELLNNQLQSEAPNQEKISYYTKIINDNSVKIQNMISGMLKIASINQIVPNKENVNIYHFLNDYNNRYQNEAEIVIKGNDSIHINADTDLMDSIFSNLIENSIRFTSEGKTRIIFELSYKKDVLSIDYNDNGIGVDPNIVKNMFNPFIKSQNSSGLGLGMTIITRSLQRMDGTIICVPNNNGAKFHIEIINS